MRAVPSEHAPGVVAVITGDLARYAQAMRSIANLQAPPNSCEFWRMANNVATSINEAFRTTLENPDYQWCWLMGDDHVFHETTLISLLDRNVDVVLPLCLNRFPPFEPVIMKAGTPKFLGDLPETGMYQLQDGETCGDAGLLIRRNVLETIRPPWYDRLRSGALGVDDQVFTDRVKRSGFTVNIDLDTRIGHMTPITLLPINKNGKWEVRIICGGKHAADLIPQRAKQ